MPPHQWKGAAPGKEGDPVRSALLRSKCRESIPSPATTQYLEPGGGSPMPRLTPEERQRRDRRAEWAALARAQKNPALGRQLAAQYREAAERCADAAARETGDAANSLRVVSAIYGRRADAYRRGASA